MEDVVYYNELYDIYGELLTEKQKNYFEDYYFINLSFSEMADNYDVSRNAVFKQLHIVKDKLDEYESILKLRYKKNKIHDIIKTLPDKIKEEIEEVL